MAYDVPRKRDSDSLKLLASLQVKIKVLRRAQTLAPELVDELQATIDEIERQLRALD